ncbi:MAG: copper resistance protein CopC [Acidimicrobiales bacterium]
MAAPTRLARRALALVVLSFATLALLPAPSASAHASLEASVPAPSSVLEEAPDAIVLDFDEPIEAGLSAIQLFDQSERLVDIGATVAADSDASVVTASLPDLDDGIYAVVWRVASADGHVVNGAFGFSIGTAGDTSGLIDDVRDGATADAAVTRIADISRFVLFIGLVLLVGAGLWSLVAPSDGLNRAQRAMPVVGWALAFVASVLGYGLYGAAAVAGSLSDAFSPSVWGRIDGTQTGRMTLIRIGLLTVLGVLLWWRRSSGAMWWRQVAVACAVGALITLSAAGHPSVTSPKALYVLLDAVHLIAIVVWMGGLALLATGRRSWYDDPGVERLARSFSRSVTVAVPVIVITGVLQAWKLAGGPDDLTDTSWGRTLLVKLALVSVVVAIGAVSRWLLHNVSVVSLRRTVLAEAVLGVAVLAFTASLVTLPPAPVAQGEVFNATLTQAGLIVDITVTPGRVGSNEVHFVITPPGGSITPVSSVTARMTLPSDSVPESPVTITQEGPNHYTGAITLPFKGDWTLEVIVEITPGNTALLKTTVPIP